LHVGYGRRLRLEHRTNAQEQGYAVARNIMGANEPFMPVPYFWTDHFGVRIQLAGHVPDDTAPQVVEETDDRLVQVFGDAAVLAWNYPRAFAQYRRELKPFRKDA
jgi:NADPH-dependent 2,4-dienoyl-CoA reductase/sulfur reductase-like enzyme